MDVLPDGRRIIHLLKIHTLNQSCVNVPASVGHLQAQNCKFRRMFPVFFISRISSLHFLFEKLGEMNRMGSLNSFLQFRRFLRFLRVLCCILRIDFDFINKT